MKTTNEKNFTNEAFIIGNEILKSFQDGICTTLENYLKPIWGDKWFDKCLIEESGNKKSSNDLQGILRQLVFRNNGNFRLALAKSLFGTEKLTKTQLDFLSNIQTQRNLWAHPDNKNITIPELKNLSRNIKLFYGSNHNELTEYCDFILLTKIDDEKSIPKILLNSTLFKKHISAINEIFVNLNHTPILENQIHDLKSELTKLQEKILTPNTEELSEDNKNNLIFTTHFAIDTLAGRIFLEMLYCGLFSLMLGSLQKTKSKKVEKLISDFSEKNLAKMASAFDSLTEIYKMVSTLQDSSMGSDKCSCLFCKAAGKSGTMGVLVSPNDEIFEFAHEVYKAHKKSRVTPRKKSVKPKKSKANLK